MCFRELLQELRRNGVAATESQIRWAIKTEKVSRPRIDGSLRFDFSDQKLDERIRHFRKPEPATCP